MRRNIFNSRRFLNQGPYHSIAAVVASLYVDEDPDWNYIVADFTISNCDRSISLEVDTNDLHDLANSIWKMEQIEEVAKGLKLALITAKEEVKIIEEKRAAKKAAAEEKKVK